MLQALVFMQEWRMNHKILHFNHNYMQDNNIYQSFSKPFIMYLLQWINWKKSIQLDINKVHFSNNSEVSNEATTKQQADFQMNISCLYYNTYEFTCRRNFHKINKHITRRKESTSKPELSYCLLFSGSDKMLYEYATSLKSSEASGLLAFLSGWYLKSDKW